MAGYVASISNENTLHVKAINYARIIIYFYAISAQVFWEWALDPSAFAIDTMIVLVPLVLSIIDGTLLYWSSNHPRRFWNALPFVSILAILVSLNTIWVTFYDGKWYAPHLDLFVLCIVVIVASVFEILLWIERNHLIMQNFKSMQSDEIRTYDF